MTLTPPALRPLSVEAKVPPPPRRQQSWLPVAADVVIAVFSLVVAYLAFQRVRRGLGGPLDVSTEVIGYNTFHNFNAGQYLQTFYLGAVGAPLLAIGIFAAIRWCVGRLVRVTRVDPQPLLPALRSAAMPESRPEFAGLAAAVGLRGVARVVGPGIVIGVAFAIQRGSGSGAFWRYVALGAAAYVFLVAIASFALHAITTWVAPLRLLLPTLAAQIAATNGVLAVLTILGVWVESDATEVTSADGTVHRYQWLPLPVAIAIAAAAAGAVFVGLLRGRNNPDNVAKLEQRAVMLIAAPVLVYLVVARIWPPGATFNTFEQGQELSTVHFVQQGMVPWRDFISDHGIFEDTLRQWVGAAVIDNSAWGMLAAETLVVGPLCYVGLMWLAYRIRPGMAFPLFIGVLFLHQNAVFIHYRFMLWPLLLILLWVALEGRQRWAPPALGFLMVAFTVLTPEAAFCAIGAGIAVILADLYRGDFARGQRLRSFRISIGVVMGAAATLGLTAGILAALGAIRGFVLYFRVATGDHGLLGALPLQPFERPYSTWAVLPAIGVVLSILILAIKLRRRVVLGAEDFVMTAATVLTVLYYQKFTARADEHVLHVYAASIPLLMIVGHQLMEGAARVLDRALNRLRDPLPRLSGPVAALALIGAIVTMPVGLTTHLRAVPTGVRAQATTVTPTSTTLGWLASPEPQTADLKKFLAHYLTPGQKMYDMTGEPGLFYFLLGYTPAARYYSIPSAYTRLGQKDLIDDLERTKPLIIAMYGDALGALPAWDDVVNEVRSYDVSQWILDRYRPLVGIGGVLLYVDAAAHVPEPLTVLPTVGLREPTATTGLPFHLPICSWGYAPDFLNVTPASTTSAAAPILSQSAGAASIRVPDGHVWSDFHWIELTASGSGFAADDAFSLVDGPDGPGEHHEISFATLASMGATYRFPIGACPQWHGYGGSTLELTHTGGSVIAAVRLLP